MRPCMSLLLYSNLRSILMRFGRCGRQSRTPAELDAAVETYVASISQTCSQHSHFDFEVSDATAKLEELGLIAKENPARPGASHLGHVEAEPEGLLHVLPLTEATHILDVCNYRSVRQGDCPAFTG